MTRQGAAASRRWPLAVGARHEPLVRLRGDPARDRRRGGARSRPRGGAVERGADRLRRSARWRSPCTAPPTATTRARCSSPRRFAAAAANLALLVTPVGGAAQIALARADRRRPRRGLSGRHEDRSSAGARATAARWSGSSSARSPSARRCRTCSPARRRGLAGDGGRRLGAGGARRARRARAPGSGRSHARAARFDPGRAAARLERPPGAARLCRLPRAHVGALRLLGLDRRRRRPPPSPDRSARRGAGGAAADLRGDRARRPALPAGGPARRPDRQGAGGARAP